MAKPSQIRKLDGPPPFIRMAVVAPPGWGKTIFGGTARKGLFLTTDPEGTLSAQQQGSTCEEWKITSWQDLTEAASYMKSEGCDEYDWLIIDNISEAQDMAMQDSMEYVRKGKPSLDQYVPGIYEYQRSQMMIVDFVKRVNDLPVNVLWTAHRTTGEDDEGNVVYGASIHGKKGAIEDQILGYMNVVGFGVIKDGERIMHLSNTGPFKGKDRYQKLGAARAGLTIPRLEALVRGDKTPTRREGTRPVRTGTGATTNRPVPTTTTTKKRPVRTSK